DLFRAFTGEEASIGAELTRLMVARSADDPLLVSTASDIALFPGAGAAPEVESFRKSTRGFIELTAVSHLPLALCYLARMRELGDAGGDADGAIGLPVGPDGQASVDAKIDALIAHGERVRRANTEAMWRDHVALRAFAGLEA